MATFFVGQRVRIVHVKTDRHLIGREGRINEIRQMDNLDGIKCNWVGYGLDIWPIQFYKGALCAWTSDQLEPILPSGHQPCDTEFKRDLDRLLEGVAA